MCDSVIIKSRRWLAAAVGVLITAMIAGGCGHKDDSSSAAAASGAAGAAGVAGAAPAAPVTAPPEVQAQIQGAQTAARQRNSEDQARAAAMKAAQEKAGK